MTRYSSTFPLVKNIIRKLLPEEEKRRGQVYRGPVVGNVPQRVQRRLAVDRDHVRAQVGGVEEGEGEGRGRPEEDGEAAGGPRGGEPGQRVWLGEAGERVEGKVEGGGLAEDNKVPGPGSNKQAI